MSLLIIDHVVQSLKADASLQQQIGKDNGKMRLYPLAIPEGAEMPFVVVSDAVVEPHSETKDGGVDYDDDLVMVVAVARDLGEATRLALNIRKALECKTVVRDDFEVTSAWLEKAQPNYNQDLRAMVWELTFGFESNDIY